MVLLWTLKALNHELVGMSMTAPESMQLEGRALNQFSTFRGSGKGDSRGMSPEGMQFEGAVNVRKSLSPLRGSSEALSPLRSRSAWGHRATPATKGSRDGPPQPTAAPENMQLEGCAVNLRESFSFSPSPLRANRASSALGKRISPTRGSLDGSPSQICQIGIRGLLDRASSSGPLPLPPSPPLGRVEEDPRHRPALTRSRPPPLMADPDFSPRISSADRVAVSRVDDAKPFSVFSPKACAATVDENASKRIFFNPSKGYNEVKPFSVYSPMASAAVMGENAEKSGPFKGFKKILAPETAAKGSVLMSAIKDLLAPSVAWRQRRSPPPHPRALPCSKDVLAPEKLEKRDDGPVRQRMLDYDAARPRPRPRRALSRLDRDSQREFQAQEAAPAFASAFKSMMPEEGTDRHIADFLCAEILSRVGRTTPSPRSVLAAHAPEFQAWMQGAGAENAATAPVDLVFIAQISRAEDNSFATRLSLAPPAHAPPPTPKGAWTDGSPGTLGGLYLDAVPMFRSRRAAVAGEAWGRLRAQNRASSKFAERAERLGSSAAGGEERDGWFQQIVCKRVALVGVKSERDVMVL
ncbi:hypothetical protein T484DRAFT_2025925 [Baffinella frigidus]|nr:hypothetical protein T484DRAFT_2025925 [Cryptophyta sp. CCMP2293]